MDNNTKIKLDLPKAKGLFVTGTDTEVGKTLIAAAIAKLLTNQGKRVGVFKPIASGCRKDREGLISSDAEFLAFCSDSEFPLSVINPVTFELPAAPSVCEEAENRKVDFEQISSAYKHICENCDVIIAEGIGGIRVPISENFDILDLAIEFKLPVVIVARPGLGTINHTLLTIDSVRSVGLTVVGVVINGYDETTAGIAERTGPATIAKYGRVNILATVPFDETVDVEQGVLGEHTVDALSRCDWDKIIRD